MSDRDRIREAVFAAIDEFNLQLPPERHIVKSLDAVLFGPSARFTSLELVSLILKTEQAIEDTFGRPVTLTSEKAMSESSSPFQSVGTLVEFVAELMAGGGDE